MLNPLESNQGVTVENAPQKRVRLGTFRKALASFIYPREGEEIVTSPPPSEIARFRKTREVLAPSINGLEQAEALAKAGLNLVGGLLSVTRSIRTILDTIDHKSKKK